ncbi:MAG: YceI family protein [Saprospiraceae bacterium]|nr:YceI family protein [Saprospiraceae bacterium]
MSTATVNVGTKWVLDTTHSEIHFKVKHLMISNVKGEFRKFSAEVEGADFSTARIRATIDAGSVFTNDEKRDGHLQSADFFDVANYPEIGFEASSFRQKNGSDYVLTGILTIKGVSKEVTFDAEFGGINKDPWGNEKAGFSLNGKINRKDWGLNWNAALETGGVLVSEEVVISAEIQFAKQA